MNDDIVTRLRLWACNAKEQDAVDVVQGLCAAADEIEKLRAERDEARRQVCSYKCQMIMDKYPDADTAPQLIALNRGWDCFKEDAR